MINKLIFNYRSLVFIYVKMNNLNDYLLNATSYFNE
ncbi:Uncharacterised protein [Empedobacter falsenii]|uniref:Uncharacterized protein n=1 Tax=Empedobacter falsenii TaxID=343874 RepID=A0A376GAH1_9FLAO|nr:Uncharacterised protein [Empedobacter falsenii]